jgi:hypothetical protein
MDVLKTSLEEGITSKELDAREYQFGSNYKEP